MAFACRTFFASDACEFYVSADTLKLPHGKHRRGCMDGLNDCPEVRRGMHHGSRIGDGKTG